MAKIWTRVLSYFWPILYKAWCELPTPTRQLSCLCSLNSVEEMWSSWDNVQSSGDNTTHRSAEWSHISRDTCDVDVWKPQIQYTVTAEHTFCLLIGELSPQSSTLVMSRMIKYAVLLTLELSSCHRWVSLGKCYNPICFSDMWQFPRRLALAKCVAVQWLQQGPEYAQLSLGLLHC